MNPDLRTWLLSGPPWVQYRTLTDLLGESEDSPAVVDARNALREHPKIVELIDQLADWPGYPLKRHNDASHPIHKFSFLADIGLTAADPGVETIINRILDHQSEEGPFQIQMNIHPRYGGRGGDQFVWMLCDAPVVVYSLIRFGLADNPHLREAVRYLNGLVRDNGWPCAVTSDLGRFKGPGRKSDPCPYANLVMLKALGLVPAWREENTCLVGSETLLDLWTRRKEVRPYLFAMGTHFSRLKAPLIWYDILHVLDVLSRFPRLYTDDRFIEMTTLLENKADEIGRFTPESVWMTWKGWEFAQKKEPSYWITFIAQRILNRIKKM